MKGNTVLETYLTTDEVSKFVANVLDESSPCLSRLWLHHYEWASPSQAIAGMFSWSITPEGLYYWFKIHSRVHKEWRTQTMSPKKILSNHRLALLIPNPCAGNMNLRLMGQSMVL